MDETKCQVLPDVPDGLPSDYIPVGLPLCVMELIAQRWTRTAREELTHPTRGARPMEVDEVAFYAHGGLPPILLETAAHDDESGSRDVSRAGSVHADQEVKVAAVFVPTRASLKEDLVDVFAIVSLFMNLIVMLCVFQGLH